MSGGDERGPHPTARRPGDAATALADLDEHHACWRDGVAGLTEAELLAPVGEAEGPWAGTREGLDRDCAVNSDNLFTLPKTVLVRRRGGSAHRG